MNIEGEQNNNRSLLNIYYELKQRYKQIYSSNKLHFFQLPTHCESKQLWENKKYTKYSGSQRLLKLDEYEKLTNMNKNNLSESQNSKVKSEQFEDSSATDSLSLAGEDEKYSIKIMDSMLWQELLKQQQGIFQPLDFEDFLITTLTHKSEILENFDILLDKGYYSKLFQGFCLKNNEKIAIKIQFYQILQLVENQYSYSLQAKIYNLYPKQFLRIDLPIYIQQNSPDHIKIVSKYELGQINLYKYCLQNKIDQNEINLIYQQVLQQILLLHKHNIAHRDVKPQNIVFVENKGWLLCDFEFSMKYQNLITICQIKGTKSFLPPYLFQISNIQGVEAKQDLFYNDQYALGITLIVIKHQIQNSNNIQDFILNETDPNILFLLKESQKDNLQQNNINYLTSFIKPEVIPVIKEFSNKFHTYQLHFLIMTFQQLARNNQSLRDQLIQLIDDNLDINRDDYFFLNVQIYENLTIYLTQFKNLIDLEVLKSRKFWIQSYYQENQHVEIRILKFLQTLGLQEILLKLGKKYLNKNYSVAAHALMIQMLFFLKEDNLVQEEYKQMLKIKEFQYMSSIEQSQFIEFTMQLFHWNLIDEKDIIYIEKYYYDKNFHIDDYILDLYKSDKDAEDSFLNLICEQENHQDKPQAILDHFKEFIQKFGSNQLNLCSNHCLRLYQLAFQRLDLKYSVKLDKLLLNQVKFFAFTIQYQQLLKQSLYLQFLYTQNLLFTPEKAKIIKSINSIFMFQQESQQQQNILNIIKQSSTLIYKIKNQEKLSQIIYRVYDMCNQFDGLTYNFYKIVFLDQLHQILYSSKIAGDHPRFWYKICQWLTKKISLVNRQIEYTDIGLHYDYMINYWICVRNQKRHDQLVFQLSNSKQNKQRYEYKLAQIHNDIRILTKLKQNKRLINHFLQIQHLYR